MNNADVLGRLIRACVDDECTLRHERKFVDGVRAEVLRRFATERGEFVVALEALSERRQSRPGSSWAELLREAGRNVWVLAAGRNDGDAIATCRHSRARTAARYEEAIQGPLPTETRRVLGEQLRRLEAEADELTHLQF